MNTFDINTYLDTYDEPCDPYAAADEDYSSALGKAIHMWRTGRRISMTLASELMAEGYDVGALEARHATC